jgi:hypothetical protein
MFFFELFTPSDVSHFGAIIIRDTPPLDFETTLIGRMSAFLIGLTERMPKLADTTTVVSPPVGKIIPRKLIFAHFGQYHGEHLEAVKVHLPLEKITFPFTCLVVVFLSDRNGFMTHLTNMLFFRCRSAAFVEFHHLALTAFRCDSARTSMAHF